MVSPNLIRLLYLIIIYSNTSLVFYVSGPEQDQLITEFKENLKDICFLNASSLTRDELLNACIVLERVAIIDFNTDSLEPSRVVQDLRDDLKKYRHPRINVHKIMTESAGWSCNGGFRNLSQVQDSYSGTSETVDWFHICQIPQISLYRQYLNFEAMTEVIRLDDKYPANCSELGFTVQGIDLLCPDYEKTRIMIQTWRVLHTGSWCRMKCPAGTNIERVSTNSTLVESCLSCAQCRDEVFDSETCYTPAYKVPAVTLEYDIRHDYRTSSLVLQIVFLFGLVLISLIRHGFVIREKFHLKLQFMIIFTFISLNIWQVSVEFETFWLYLNTILLQIFVAASMFHVPFEDRMRHISQLPIVEEVYIWSIYVVPPLLSSYLIATLEEHEKFIIDLYERWLRSNGFSICLVQLVCCQPWHLYVYHRHRDQYNRWLKLIRMIFQSVLVLFTICQWTSYHIQDYMMNAVAHHNIGWFLLIISLKSSF